MNKTLKKVSILLSLLLLFAFVAPFVLGDLVLEDLIGTSGEHNTIVSGSFTLKDDTPNGEDETDITISITDLTGLGDSIPFINVFFDPDFIPILPDGTSTPIDFTISIPQYQTPGLYTGTVTSLGGDSSDTATLTLTVNSNPALSINPSTLDLEEERDESVSKDITIQNTGNTQLSFDVGSFNFNQADFSDGDGGTENITITFTPTSFSLSPGESKPVTVNVNIPGDILLDNYEGEVNITSGTTSDTFILEVDVTPKDVRKICEDGRVGLLEISKIDEPGNDEKVQPWEEIDIEVDVDNDDDDDMKVEFTAFLIDKEDDDALEKVETSSIIDKERDHDFKVKLRVPADIKEDDDRYAVYVVANEKGREDDHCAWDKADVKIDKDNDDVVVTDLEPTEFVCGMPSDITIKVINAGNDDQDDIQVSFFIPGLEIEKQSTRFDLDKEDDQIVAFTFDLPEGTEAGTYGARVEVRDNDKDLFERGIKGFDITIDCPTPRVSASLTLSASTFTAVRKDSSISTTATVTNTGDAEQDFILRVVPIGTWTDAIETSFTLAKGASDTGVLTLIVREEGSHAATIQVLVAGDVVASQSISVSAAGVLPVTGGVTAQTAGSLAVKEQLPLVVTIAVLALAIIALIIWLIVVYSMGAGAAKSTSDKKGLREVKEAVKGRAGRRGRGPRRIRRR